jgi:hypothetical protein
MFVEHAAGLFLGQLVPQGEGADFGVGHARKNRRARRGVPAPQAEHSKLAASAGFPPL